MKNKYLLSIICIILFSCNAQKSVNNDSPKQESISTPIGLIVGSIGYNEDSQNTSDMIEHRRKGILDVVLTKEAKNEKLTYWNKIFYQNLPYHYIVTEQEFTNLKNILDIKETSRHLLANSWPDSISMDTYKKLYKSLNLNFVRYEEYSYSDHDKYLLTFNEKFWDIKTLTKKNVLADILNQKLYSYEQFNDEYEESIKNGLILTTAVCVNHSSENSYWYSKLVTKHLGTISDSLKIQLEHYGFEYRRNMPIFNFNMQLYKKEERMNQYEIAKDNEGKLLNFYLKIYQNLAEKPFNILKLETEENK